jgi:hypothetical protein
LWFYNLNYAGSGAFSCSFLLPFTDSAGQDVKPIIDFVEKVMLCAMLLTAIYCSSGVRQSYSGVGRSGGAAKLRRTQATK